VLCCVVQECVELSVLSTSSSSTEFGVESEFLCFTTSKIRRWFHRKESSSPVTVKLPARVMQLSPDGTVITWNFVERKDTSCKNSV
jgi:hypothetical protein